MGTKVTVVLPERSEDQVSNDLRRLTHTLIEKCHVDEPGWGLGGSYGYGVNFSNGVFSMRPYYWGVCACGYEAFECLYDFKEEHSEECFHTRLKKFEDSLKAQGMKKFGPASDQFVTAVTEWAHENGYASGWCGCAVYCDCGRNERWDVWWAHVHEQWCKKEALPQNSPNYAGEPHRPDCSLVLPNFRHFTSGLEIRWYKWIGRDMEFTKEEFDWGSIFEECLESLDIGEETSCDSG